jgi:hypothetical protein
MLQLITSITIIIMALSAARANCDCLVPANNSHTLNANDFSAIFTDSIADVDANFAALNQAVSLLNVSFTRTQLAAFLGTIRSNTENLRRHRARCAETNTCAVQYDLVCSNQADNDTRHFYPRSALMISYQCNYADLDAVLRSSLPCLRSIEAEPDLISDRLLYSYLASVAAWTNTDCMALTDNTMDQFGTCVDILNPHLCTERGQNDRRDLIASVNLALLALNVTNVQLPDQLPSCGAPSTSDPVSTPSNITTPVPSSNMTDPVTSSNVNASNGTGPDLDLGMLTRSLFRSYFSNANITWSDAHYNALIGSLLLANANQLDKQQTSFLLAAIKTRTDNLTRTDTSVINADQAQFPIAIVTSLLSGHIPDDILPDIIPDLVIFYIGFTNDLHRSGCMTDVSQNLYDLCLNSFFPSESCSVNPTGHDAIVAGIEQALALMKANSDLSSFNCHDDVTSHAMLSTSTSIWPITLILAAGLCVII